MLYAMPVLLYTGKGLSIVKWGEISYVLGISTLNGEIIKKETAAYLIESPQK